MPPTSSVRPPACCHNALGSRPKLIAAPLATPLLRRPAELVSRGFVQSLEAASTNAQRSDLVRAVLVRLGKQTPSQAALGPLSKDPSAIAALPSLSPALAPLLLLQPPPPHHNTFTSAIACPLPLPAGLRLLPAHWPPAAAAPQRQEGAHLGADAQGRESAGAPGLGECQVSDGRRPAGVPRMVEELPCACCRVSCSACPPCTNAPVTAILYTSFLV